MGAIKLTKPTFKHIEAEWFAYHDTVTEIKRIREHIMFCTDNEDENVGGGRSSLPSAPTETIAIRLTMNKKLKYLEEIAEAIEKVFNALPDDYKKLVRLRYWSAKKDYTWDGLAKKLNVGRRTAIRWRDEIMQATGEVLGWR
ncbi:hypothetical protein [Bacillus badius]|uniref:Phage regulatory protein n=1 Tax=Bacillus badius TaxID=1455 RepID=A0ABR5AXV2_BACBA|nr:hypothetical protein [Bacillus badius]KIL79571.1 Phage regulatory protein [Bacillus badius]MED4716266.1 transcriptional regulator [Bacillus badius]UAT29433.1 transcriptional regulator [Bacillus badius]GLY11394.1 hypothetical protein Bbad01_26100 [Bacillus badius]